MRTSYKLYGSDQLVIAFNSHKQAETYANKTGLKLAEYGDCYGSNIAYAFWNKSGNRNDQEKVIAYYTWNEHGKPAPLSKEQFLRKLGLIY